MMRNYDALRSRRSLRMRPAGARSLLAVPMLKEGNLIGAIAIYSTEGPSFHRKADRAAQELRRSGRDRYREYPAAQRAAAAHRDLSEALEQQTATSEVLQVISSSPGELEPVFQTMLENAMRICEAKFGTCTCYDGDMFRRGALHNAPPAFAEFLQAARTLSGRLREQPSIACCGSKSWCTCA